MAEREGSGVGRAVVWVASALAIAGIAAMVWMWRGGGVQLEPTAEARAPVEECSATISGATAMAPRLAPEIAAAFLSQNGYSIERNETVEGVRHIVGARGALRCSISIRASSSTQGLRDLGEGKTLIALSQRPITQRDIALLRAANAGDFAAERTQAEHVVAFDAYTVAVNAANPVRSITVDAVRDIALGVAPDWSSVGGDAAAFTLYTPIDGVGPEDYPNDLIQRPNPVWQDARLRARVLANESDAVAALARDPAGIGFISGAFVAGDPGVRALALAAGGPPQSPSADNVRAELYPLARRLFVYVRPNDMRSNTFVQRFVAFFSSPAAFDIIDKAGFVALRPESRMSRVAATLSGCRFGTAEYAALISATNGATRMPVELTFEPNTLRLDEEARHFVSENAETLRERLRTGGRIVLVGHTDYTGETAKNRALALRRALAARAAFERQGLFGIEVESAGEQCPSGDNDTPEGRLQNRRVEIWLKAQSAPG
ncbi:MAG: substrate-binding domain-containing protein [Hyphomonadaceae bacterium]|nr:substrate-binding domain-containing protein [Hyphomonadaceae bacterium]